MKKANVITGVVFLALSIFAYMQAQKMVGKIMTDALGPGFWPKVLGLMMGVLSLALIVEGLFGKQAEGEKVPIAFGTEGFRFEIICGADCFWCDPVFPWNLRRHFVYDAALHVAARRAKQKDPCGTCCGKLPVYLSGIRSGPAGPSSHGTTLFVKEDL